MEQLMKIMLKVSRYVGENRIDPNSVIFHLTEEETVAYITSQYYNPHCEQLYIYGIKVKLFN